MESDGYNEEQPSKKARLEEYFVEKEKSFLSEGSYIPAQGKDSSNGHRNDGVKMCPFIKNNENYVQKGKDRKELENLQQAIVKGHRKNTGTNESKTDSIVGEKISNLQSFNSVDCDVADEMDYQNKNTDNLNKRYSSNRVETPGEMLEHGLRDFQVLDEVEGDDDGAGSMNGPKEKCGDSSEESDGREDSSSDLDLNLSDLDDLLEEGLPDELKEKQKSQQFEEFYKVILEEKGVNHFEVLPEGWLQISHCSGVPLYLHKKTRVCSVSRPYFLGPGSARRHQVPLSAIPCLNYRKAVEKEQEEKENLAASKTNSVNESNNDDSTSKEMGQSSTPATENKIEPNMLPIPNAKIETVKENMKAQSLTPEEVNDYCKRLFHFKKIRVMKFKSWSARRKFHRSRKHIKNLQRLQRPSLPDGTKLITFPVLNNDNESSSNTARPRKEFIMNPNGKSFVCILHEYLQHALKKQPFYEFRELENAATPYCAIVSVDGIKYGTGYGTSKKQAKAEAARETLEVFIPHMREKLECDKQSGNKNNSNMKDLSVFDEIRIEDPRVSEFCAKTTEPSPHAILLTCLQRNFGLGDIQINYQVNTTRKQKNEFTMTVGKHKATVVCKNKREGKQLASQAILQILHPHIQTWGSLLRLYGNNSIKSFKEKKMEEQEITALQSKAAINQPNYAILDKLKMEMEKLANIREAVKPIRKFVPPNDIDLPSSSGSNLKNVEL